VRKTPAEKWLPEHHPAVKAKPAKKLTHAEKLVQAEAVALMSPVTCPHRASGKCHHIAASKPDCVTHRARGLCAVGHKLK
jgi:hypothetical protein